MNAENRWELKDAKWAYDAKAEGSRPTRVPGVLVSIEAFGPEGAVPIEVLRLGRQIQEELLEETEGDEPPQLEAIVFTGSTKYWNGHQWWEFYTISSFSLTLWVGIGTDGYLTTTEEL